MRAPLACLVSLAALTGTARADEDPGMQLMGIMMKTPAISADGKHVAIYSHDPGTEKDAKTSLAVFGSKKGNLEKRHSVVPPNTDAARARAAAATLVKLLDAGGYKRMSRVARVSEEAKKTDFATQLKSEDLVIDVRLVSRKLDISASRDGKKLKAVSKKLPAKEGACKAVDGYDIANTMAGYDATTGAFAFSVTAEEAGTVCFSHDFVVTLK